jgi:glycosyltransferase involved in cell wall biosynthesis
MTACSMKDSPFFSIVIPTYNRAALIETTLESVFRQTYRNYEVIVVDNCSTDNTDDVLAPYVRDGRIRFIKHDQNYERARSRNTGMSAASGDFVTLLDSDDLMYPENLADAANFIAGNPETRAFHNLYHFVTPEGEVVYRLKFPSLTNQLLAISRGNFLSCIGTFIHRDVYTQLEFDTNPFLTGGEDWDYWLRVLARYKLGRIEKVNSANVQHPGRSVLSQEIATLEKGLEHLFDKITREPELAATYAPYLKHIKSSSMMYLATLANRSGLRDLALRYLARAANNDRGVVLKFRFLRILQMTLTGSTPKVRVRAPVIDKRGPAGARAEGRH